MQVKIKKDRLVIMPETEQDLAFLEDTMSLKKEGDRVELVRSNAIPHGARSEALMGIDNIFRLVAQPKTEDACLVVEVAGCRDCPFGERLRTPDADQRTLAGHQCAITGKKFDTGEENKLPEDCPVKAKPRLIT